MRQEGFVAVTSAIIISVLLLTITLSVSLSGYFSRFNVLDSESKERSVALAEACGDTAIYNFAQDPLYSVSFGSPQTVTVSGSDECKIMMVKDNTPISGKVLIKTQGVINKATTDLIIQIDNIALTIDSWEECTNLTSSTTSC